jgi:ribonucleoside-triphosphate reductase
MHEACLNFLGKGIETQEGKEFAAEILDLMREKLIEFQKETGNNYNLEATPAEGVSYRLAKIDSEKYPDIITSICNEKKQTEPFYTNSTQLPVNYTNDMFELLDLQDNVQVKYTGGTVIHLFLGERVQDTTALKNLVKKICTNYRLPYFSITPTFSVCPVCGYLTGEQHSCNKCGESCEVYSRVVGYLRPVKQWNKGKKAEFSMRKTLKV